MAAGAGAAVFVREQRVEVEQLAGAGEIERLADQADQNESRGRHRPKRKLEQIHRPGAGKMGDEAKGSGGVKKEQGVGQQAAKAGHHLLAGGVLPRPAGERPILLLIHKRNSYRIRCCEEEWMSGQKKAKVRGGSLWNSGLYRSCSRRGSGDF